MSSHGELSLQKKMHQIKSPLSNLAVHIFTHILVEVLSSCHRRQFDAWGIKTNGMIFKSEQTLTDQENPLKLSYADQQPNRA